jgi:predicted XRE-type DNA-binding protein
MVMTEKLFNFLLEKKPTYAALVDDVRTHFNLSVKNFRAFVKAKEHIFLHGMLPKQDVIPPKPNEEKKVKERLVHAVKIIDPNFDIFSLYHDEKEEVEEEVGFFQQTQQVMRASLAWQVVKKIEQSEHVGMSQAEIASYFGLTRLNARAIIRKVTKNHEITSYLNDEGRQRTSKYIHKKYKQDNTRKIVEQVAKLVQKAEEITNITPPPVRVVEAPKAVENEGLKVSIPLKLIHPEADETEVINILQNVPTEEIISSNENSVNTDFFKDAFMMEVEEPCVIGNIENVEVIMRFLNTLPGQKTRKGLAMAIAQNKVSEKVLNRMNIILDILREKTIIDGLQLLNLVRQKEEHLKELICRKSLLTLCNQLTADNFLKVIEMELKSPTKTVKTLYLGEPHVTLDMRCWHSIIEEKKIQHFLRPIDGKKYYLF